MREKINDMFDLKRKIADKALLVKICELQLCMYVYVV